MSEWRQVIDTTDDEATSETFSLWEPDGYFKVAIILEDMDWAAGAADSLFVKVEYSLDGGATFVDIALGETAFNLDPADNRGASSTWYDVYSLYSAGSGYTPGDFRLKVVFDDGGTPATGRVRVLVARSA